MPCCVAECVLMRDACSILDGDLWVRWYVFALLSIVPYIYWMCKHRSHTIAYIYICWGPLPFFFCCVPNNDFNVSKHVYLRSYIRLFYRMWFCHCVYAYMVIAKQNAYPTRVSIKFTMANTKNWEVNRQHRTIGISIFAGFGLCLFVYVRRGECDTTLVSHRKQSLMSLEATRRFGFVQYVLNSIFRRWRDATPTVRCGINVGGPGEHTHI